MSLPKTQTVAGQHCSSNQEVLVFCRSYEEPLQGRVNGAGTLLELMYYLREIMLKNKNNFEIINLFFHC
jgi:hypothetical protein